MTRPELGSVLGWLARQAGRGVSVRTVRQVIGGPVRPAVAGTGPRPVPPPGVVNSRLAAVTAAGLRPVSRLAGSARTTPPSATSAGPARVVRGLRLFL